VLHLASKPLGRFSPVWASKPVVSVSGGLASKLVMMVFSGLASKSVAAVFSSLASKLVGMVISSLASKLVTMVSFGLALKTVVSFLVEPQNQGGGGFPDFGFKTGSFSLMIWASKSLQWFLGLGFKTKCSSICWLRHKTDRGRTACDMRRDLTACFM
jgi:hypothetical protein